MVNLFRGRFEAKVDQKSRVALAAGLRQSLPEDDLRLVITNTQYKKQNALDVYSYAAWLELEERMNTLPKLNAKVQAFRRFYLSAAQVVEPDAQNRFLIPKSLKDYANIDTEVILVGMGEKFELWNKLSWNSIHNELSENFEDILAGVAELEGENK